ncbi:YdbT family protein [Halorubrum vacuolatum]|uniref:PH domain-containing protein n=1 Tax=Halorubrum vacuolatum TaxID=63740 RepID=A0A238WJ65_HALVU|nr:hypothetical protein [Halorubrum vacuolatum]SNR46590.1 hypothetical protein SAMN06264855_10858 [Halorubrum vacuolatum]
MVSQAEIQEAEAEIRNAEPSHGLRNQVPPDQEIQWVAKRDLRTAWLSLILHKIKTLVILFGAGIVAAFVVLAALGFIWGFLAFLLIGILAPVGYIGYKYYYMKNTHIEYAATDEQFIRYRDTPSTTRSESLPINRAKDAKFRQDRWDKFLDTGDILVRGLGSAKNIRVKDVPNPEAVHRVIQQQIADAEQVDDMAAAGGSVHRRNVTS